MLARQTQDDSGALSFSDIKNIGSIAFHVGDAVKDIFDGYVSFLVLHGWILTCRPYQHQRPAAVVSPC